MTATAADPADGDPEVPAGISAANAASEAPPVAPEGRAAPVAPARTADPVAMTVPADADPADPADPADRVLPVVASAAVPAATAVGIAAPAPVVPGGTSSRKRCPKG